jgi:putative flavoprotein involved in K+ transport
VRERLDIVVIGGGQAGLAMSAVLRERGREHVVVERQRIGECWRSERWDSLRFQFPNWSLQLPGYAYPGDDPEGFAHYLEILRVIEDYAASTQAPVREHTEVTGLAAGESGFDVSVTDGSFHARNVVIATGPFQRPRIPALAAGLPSSVLQTDPTRYRGPDELPAGSVLVVGSGASGCQIADELLHAGREVYLSVSRHRRAPRRYRGRDIYWWLDRMGRLAQTIDTFPGRAWPPSIVVTGVNGGYDVNVRQMAARGVTVIGRVIGAADATLAVDATANGTLADADDAYTGFLSAADEWARAHPDENLAPDEPAQTRKLPKTIRRPPRSTSGARASQPSSGPPATNTTTRGCACPSSTITAGRSSSAA